MQNIKAVLLVGGLGTRLRSAVPSVPKALAPLGDRPFLDLLVRQLRAQGVRRVVMCTGYLAEQIEETLGDGSGLGVTIEYSRESVPLGTAGALKLAKRYLSEESDFLVLNGDSFVEINFGEMIAFHRKHRGFATLAVVPVENSSRYGTVQVAADGRVQGFYEKTGKEQPGVINAGLYIFGPSVLEIIPEGPASLERDVFPQLLDRGVFAFQQRGLFIDIGTPEDYARARDMCDRFANAALKSQ
jgi:D-glycero-alpha-D-manno-heptose 1-phosphate guanylyltransferase